MGRCWKLNLGILGWEFWILAAIFHIDCRSRGPYRCHIMAACTWFTKRSISNSRFQFAAAIVALASPCCLACGSSTSSPTEQPAASSGGSWPESSVGGNGGSAGNAGGSGTASNGGSMDCAQPSAMVTLPQGYGIDSTEVTRCQYRTWLDTSPPTTGQDAWCAWNTDFTPDATCMSGSSVCQGAACGNHPQVCLDWCDAYAYCKAVGKRLCGKIEGGANAPDDYADPTKDQWYNACVSDDTNNAFPYGNTYDGKKCNGADQGIGTTVAVGSLPDCQSTVSGYAGVYDLFGNAWEWEDTCGGTSGPQDWCRERGGSFLTYDVHCDFTSHDARGNVASTVGFRCCAP
jgi:formylglycine-generating enzyme